MNDFLSNVKKVYSPTNYIKVTERDKISEIVCGKAKLIYSCYNPFYWVSWISFDAELV